MIVHTRGRDITSLCNLNDRQMVVNLLRNRMLVLGAELGFPWKAVCALNSLVLGPA